MKPLILSEFPPESCGSIREWVDAIADEFWRDYAEFIEVHVADPIERPNLPELTTPGWHALTDWYWEPCGPEDLPPIMTVDVEACREVEDGPYRPVLAVAYGLGRWYAWKADGVEPVIPFPANVVVVGQNVVAYDSRYFASEYENPNSYVTGLAPANITYIDVMGLAMLTRGISGGDEASRKQSPMQSLYAKCQSYIASGHAAPAWYEHAWTVSLKELAKRLLGIDLSKAVRDVATTATLDTLYDQIAGRDLLNYCALDVWATHLIAQKLIPIVDKQFFASPVSWVGMTEMGRCKTWLKDWDGFLVECDREWTETRDELAALVRELAGEATPELFSGWDWAVLTRGKYKGQPKWLQALDKADYSLGGRAAVELLQLRWDGEAIEWEQLNSRQGQWVTRNTREPLPHPSGTARLNDPLCKAYRGFAASGRLTSAVLEQEGLLDVFDALARVGQWTMFRGRYSDVYRPYRDENGLDVVKPEINPCGTLTRRATSPLWVVTPKEREGTIGSDVQRHIVAPPGYSLVYADFDAQESWLMTLLTDAQAGRIASNPWCEAVLTGDKDAKTDIHSLTAQQMGITRDQAKPVNFGTNYLMGVVSLANRLWLAVNCTYEEAEAKATEFLQYLKGDGGIANTTFATLKVLARTPHNRTPILGVKVPDSINAAWCGTEFMTTRQNWNVQSSGVDCLHALLVLTKAFYMEYEVEAHLTMHRHDAVYWLVKQGQEEIARQCMQTAHYWVKQLAYEQAVAHAHALKAREGFAGQPNKLEPPEHTLWFSSVDVGVTAGDF